MKEENKIPKFYTQFIIFVGILIIISLIFLFIEKKLTTHYYIFVIEGLIFLVILISALYSYFKMKMLITGNTLIFFNTKKRIETDLNEITELIVSGGRIALKTQDKQIFLPHSIIDSAIDFGLIYNSLNEKRADLMTDQIKIQFNKIYKNSLCFDFFTHIIDKVGFFATAMSILSFFVAVYLIVDYHSINQIGQITYLLYSLSWPFITGLLMFLRFTAKIRNMDIAGADSKIINDFFHNYSYSLIFSAFAAIFIILSVLKYYY